MGVAHELSAAVGVCHHSGRPGAASPPPPGEYLLAAGDSLLNETRATVTVAVVNRSGRPVQVNSH
ncbi:hypothetical protein GCM10022407_12500 [Hymenobacter antarcticus]|uniref:Uncharacterized protein n=1 Tax=Hymenobacter antarcticus TaxID=486270 RepID=A0ABP7PPB2_9BACT